MQLVAAVPAAAWKKLRDRFFWFRCDQAGGSRIASSAAAPLDVRLLLQSLFGKRLEHA